MRQTLHFIAIPAAGALVHSAGRYFDRPARKTWHMIYGQYPWGNNAAIPIWQTWRNGTLASSGSVGDTSLLPVGTAVGFYDTTGFDELTMKAIMLTAACTNSNALALDNVEVQLTSRPPTPVIYGSDFSVDPTNHIPSLTVWDTLPGDRSGQPGTNRAARFSQAQPELGP